MNRSKMFDDVKRMNVAFGNWEGNPQDYLKQRVQSENAWKRLERQCKNIAGNDPENGECKELFVALKARDVEAVRDALCDIMVFTLGAFHFMGYEADRDMNSVLAGVMTRFCRDEAEMSATVVKYAKLDVEVYTEGTYPTLCVKSAKDQTSNEGEFLPTGKFLKSVGYSQPVFYQIDTEPEKEMEPGSHLDQMSRLRKRTREIEKAKVEAINKQVEAYRAQLEMEVLGLPPYDPDKNNDTTVDTKRPHSFI